MNEYNTVVVVVMVLQKMDEQEHAHLVAADDMNCNHHVSHCNQPPWFLQRDENVIINRVSEGPVADQRSREVAHGHHNVSNNDTLHHRLLGWFFRS